MTAALAFRRMIFRACLLGLASLCLNVLTQTLAPQQPLQIGNILLFISARSFGIIGGTISALVSELPMNIFGGSDPFLMLRTVSVVGAIGFAARQFPLLQVGIALAIYWIVVMLPFYLTVVGGGTATPLIFLCAADLLLLSLSSLMLCSSTIWEKLTDRLRFLPMSLFLPECIFTFVGLFAGLLLIAPLGETHLFTILAQSFGLLAIIPLALTSLMPSVFGYTLIKILAQEYHSELQGGFLSSAKKTSFSGLASAYWRQKSDHEIANDMLSRQHVTGPSAPTNSEPGAPGFLAPTQGVISLNRNGTVTFVNKKLRKFAEITSNDIIGRSIDSLGMNGQFRKELLALVEATYLQGPRIVELRISDDASSQSRFFQLASQLGSSFDNSSLQDGPDGVVVTVKDITDRRTVESHLLQAKKLESLGSMVSGIAHSFNDALTSIAGHASLAQVAADPSRVTTALKEILESSHQAGMTVRQLLDFAQGASDFAQSEDLALALQARLDFFKRSIGDAYELNLEQSADSLPINCNINLIVQALLNLILNSKESYGDSSGTIVVSLDAEEIPEEASSVQPGVRPGRFARLRVKDCGAGMSPETLSKAFDPLFTTKGATGHTGLGLSIVFAVTRAHDGFLTAESHVEKGTTISLYFPLTSTADSLEPISPLASDSKKSSSITELGIRRVLVIEDDPSVLGILELMLSSLGIDSIGHSCGPDVLAELDTLQFDLFIADLILPKMGGVEVAEAIRNRYPKTPGILMTGYGLDKAINDKCLCLLRKPFDLQQLTEVLIEACTKEENV